MPILVITEPTAFDYTAPIASLREAGFDVRESPAPTPEAVIGTAPDAEVLLSSYMKVDRALIERLPHLKLICVSSMGTDTIDLAAASERGVMVANVRGAATEEVATHALALLLHLERGLGHYLAMGSREHWNDDPSPAPRPMRDRTLVVVGLGLIGLRFAELASPMYARTLGVDPYVQPGPAVDAAHVHLVDLAQAQREADVIVLTLPLSEATANLVNADFLAGMKRDALLVNVGRGGIVDSAALAEALDRGQLRGAAVDVLDTEPPVPNHPLVGRPDVLVTPHIGYLSTVTDSEYVRIQAQNAIDWITRGEPGMRVV